MARPIAPEDLTWLLMDRPNNLMHVHGFMGFDVLPDLDAFQTVVMDRMVRKFRRLSQVPVQIDGDWFWEDDVTFTIGRHARIVTLDNTDEETFREYVSDQFSQPFDRSRPLWELQLITAPDTEGGYVFGRFHHGLADGIRLVQMLISLCDPAEGAVPKKVGRNRDRQHQHLLEQVVHVAESSVTDTLDFAGKAGRALARAGRLV
ncbi:MAG: wax ester/triacylglycerol synthase family O-acyltransferase, partial [Actinomycetia bacterium]|nr:wax ester/triacylglycerol synthase family O-acyltransferase [Actinomycetes bacterium]